MKVDKIARLFAGQTGPTSIDQQQSVILQNANSDTEAVTVSDSIGGDSGSRADKVARIKASVDAGTYSPDSREVAAAVYKDLFI